MKKACFLEGIEIRVIDVGLANEVEACWSSQLSGLKACLLWVH